MSCDPLGLSEPALCPGTLCAFRSRPSALPLPEPSRIGLVSCHALHVPEKSPKPVLCPATSSVSSLSPALPCASPCRPCVLPLPTPFRVGLVSCHSLRVTSSALCPATSCAFRSRPCVLPRPPRSGFGCVLPLPPPSRVGLVSRHSLSLSDPALCPASRSVFPCL
jgi:hypothetical protein